MYTFHTCDVIIVFLSTCRSSITDTACWRPRYRAMLLQPSPVLIELWSLVDNNTTVQMFRSVDSTQKCCFTSCAVKVSCLCASVVSQTQWLQQLHPKLKAQERKFSVKHAQESANPLNSLWGEILPQYYTQPALDPEALSKKGSLEKLGQVDIRWLIIVGVIVASWLSMRHKPNSLPSNPIGAPTYS